MTAKKKYQHPQCCIVNIQYNSPLMSYSVNEKQVEEDYGGY